MKAIVIARPGGPDVLRLRDIADPQPEGEEVRVRVRATAVNRADVLQRLGRYPAPPGAPIDVPGLEFAGEVEACGGRVARIRPGDRVMGIVGGGGYAEKIVAHERLCLRIPPSLGWEEAAAVPEAFLTAFDVLFRIGRLRPGEVVLLHAAGSGVGTAALQVARTTGARVIGLSRSAEKMRRLEEMGVDRVLDATRDDNADAIRLAAGPDGVDLVVELLGAPSFALDLDVIGDGGRIVVVGTMGGSDAAIDLPQLMRKRASVTGTVLRARPIEEKIALSQAFARQMLPLLAAGRLRPVVDRVLPLGQAAEAHAAMERNENFGKIVLRVG